MSDDKKRILLVDDDAALLRGYKNALTLRGFSVETASDGSEALTRLGTTSFDVIVSDVSMPTMDGLEFLRAIRERDLDVPVVLMTGDPSVASATRPCSDRRSRACRTPPTSSRPPSAWGGCTPSAGRSARASRARRARLPQA